MESEPIETTHQSRIPAGHCSSRNVEMEVIKREILLLQGSRVTKLHVRRVKHFFAHTRPPPLVGFLRSKTVKVVEQVRVRVRVRWGGFADSVS